MCSSPPEPLDHIGRWFVAPSTVLMKREVDVPCFSRLTMMASGIPTTVGSSRWSLIASSTLTCVTPPEPRGAETVATVELIRSGAGARLRLSPTGFRDDEALVRE